MEKYPGKKCKRKRLSVGSFVILIREAKGCRAFCFSIKIIKIIK